MEEKIIIWTVGHSNRSINAFVKILKEHGIQVLVDVRSFPTSKVDHFKQEKMERWLLENGLEYVWLGEELGGYRNGGYERHMQTELFIKGVNRLLDIASKKRACIMCMETDPKYCHRRFIASHLESKGLRVIHIIAKGQKISRCSSKF